MGDPTRQKEQLKDSGKRTPDTKGVFPNSHHLYVSTRGRERRVLDSKVIFLRRRTDPEGIETSQDSKPPEGRGTSSLVLRPTS